VQFRNQRYILNGWCSSRQDCSQFGELLGWRVLVDEASRTFLLRYDWIQCVVLVMRRAEIAQSNVRVAGDPLGQGRGNAGFTNTRLTGDQHHPSAAGLSLGPTAQQLLQFLVTANKRCRA
jgi:hypothetical protein